MGNCIIGGHEPIPPPDICMWRKTDKDRKVAYLVAIVENLQRSHDITITYPTERTDPKLRIWIGESVKEKYEKYVPGEVIVEECKHKVTYGSRRETSEIRIKLRKKTAESWEHAWSPSSSRANLQNNSNPIPIVSEVE